MWVLEKIRLLQFVRVVGKFLQKTPYKLLTKRAKVYLLVL